MSLKWEIALWILARCVFIGLPETYIDPFPFSDDGMPVSSYGWVIIEMAFMCRLTWGWMKAEERNGQVIAVLFCVLVFDFAHFLLTSNSFYRKIGQYPLTNNVIMLIFWAVFAMFTGKHDIVNTGKER